MARKKHQCLIPVEILIKWIDSRIVKLRDIIKTADPVVRIVIESSSIVELTILKKILRKARLKANRLHRDMVLLEETTQEDIQKTKGENNGQKGIYQDFK